MNDGVASAWYLVASLSAAIGACATSSSHETTAIVSAAAPSPPVRAPDSSGDAAIATSPDTGTSQLSPLEASAEVAPLEVPGFRTAFISIPIGATEARPVVLALHGNFDRPEWQCEVWHAAMKGHPFVVCPRGIPRGDAPPSLDRWTYGKGVDVHREIEAALTALRERFGDH